MEELVIMFARLDIVVRAKFESGAVGGESATKIRGNAGG